MSLNKYCLILLIFMINLEIGLSKQELNLTNINIYGNWQIIKVYLTLNRKLDKEDINYLKKFKNNKIEINKNGIRSKFKELVCNSKIILDTLNCRYIKIVDNDEDSQIAPGQELVESNVIGKTFYKLLKYKLKKINLDRILVVNTNCKCDFGEFTTKICIISKNRIGIFYGAELYILNKTK